MDYASLLTFTLLLLPCGHKRFKLCSVGSGTSLRMKNSSGIATLLGGSWGHSKSVNTGNNQGYYIGNRGY